MKNINGLRQIAEFKSRGHAQEKMIKYAGREIINAQVVNPGVALDGKYFFRKRKRIENFDKLINNIHLDDYWKDKNGNFHFLYLNGSETICTPKDIEIYFDPVEEW